MTKPQIHRVDSDVFDPAGGGQMVVHGRNLSGFTDVRVGVTQATGGTLSNSVSFDSVNDLLTGAAISNFVSTTAYAGWALLVVNKAPADAAAGDGNGAILSSAGGGYWSLYVRSSGLVGMHHYDSSQKRVTANIQFGNLSLVQFRFTGTAIELRVNGGTWQTTAATTLGDATAALKAGTNYNAGLFLGAEVKELALMNASMDDTTADNVLSYINDRYGLQLGGVAASAYDPADLSLNGWWRDDTYATGTWTGVASAGGSGSRNLTEGTNPPSLLTGVTLAVVAPAKAAGQYPVAVRNADGWTSLAAAVQYANPGTIANCVWWLRPDDADVDVDGSTEVTAWRDKSGVGDSNRNVTPPTADNPVWNASDADYGGKPTIGSFNRTGTFRLTSSAWSATCSTFTLGVVGHASASGSRYFTYESGTEYNSVVNVGGTLTAYANDYITGTIASASGSSMTAKRSLGLFVANGASSLLYGDANQRADTGDLTGAVLGGAAVNVGSYVAASETYGVEKLAEVYAYSRAITLREVRTLRRYRDSYYGAP